MLVDFVNYSTIFHSTKSGQFAWSFLLSNSLWWRRAVLLLTLHAVTLVSLKVTEILKSLWRANWLIDRLIYQLIDWSVASCWTWWSDYQVNRSWSTDRCLLSVRWNTRSLVNNFDEKDGKTFLFTLKKEKRRVDILALTIQVQRATNLCMLCVLCVCESWCLCVCVASLVNEEWLLQEKRMQRKVLLQLNWNNSLS